MGATTSNGKQSAITADTITNEQIRELHRNGHVDLNTAWFAIYRDHSTDGRESRELCASTAAALMLADESIVSVEACS